MTLRDLRDLAGPPQPPPPGPIPRPEPRLPKPPKGLPRVNRERMARRKAAQEGPQCALARKRPCCICGRRPTVPHHVRSRGAGGTDADVCALCLWCHQLVHDGGAAALAADYPSIDLEHEAAKLAAELARRADHDCLEFAVLREDERTLTSRYVCQRCLYVIPDEQAEGDA